MSAPCPRRARRWIAIAALWVAVPAFAIDAEPTPSTARPAPVVCPPPVQYQPMRYEERWVDLPDPRCAIDAWERVKRIALGSSPDAPRLSLGGDARVRHERFENPGFGAGLDDRDGYLLQRWLLHGDLELTPRLRVFGQLEYSRIDGRRAGPRIADENAGDLNQLFAEWTLLRDADRMLALRVGRQEVQLGSAQFTSARDGLNDRLSFDGVRLLGTVGPWTLHAMVTQVVPTRPGRFDDRSTDDERLSGFAIAHAHAFGFDTNAAFYVNQRTRPRSLYADNTGEEDRWTIGNRWFGRNATRDWNVEFGVQRGNVGFSRIEAWYLNTDHGFTWQQAAWRPRAGVRFSVASGDHRLGDDVVGTFSPLFAATAYSGLAGLIGPSNSIHVAPSITVRPHERWEITAGASVFWRQSLADGIYDIASNLLRPPGSSDARHVGTQPTVAVSWFATRHTLVFATLSWFRAGTFLKETPPGENVTYFTTWWAYRF